MAIKWTYEKIKEEAKNHERRVDFCRKRKGAYDAAIRLKILDDVCKHMELNCSDGEIINEAQKYNTKKEFLKNAPLYYNNALKRGIIKDASAHMIKETPTKWTYEMISEEAKTYQTRNDFKKKSNRAYNAALKRGIMDEISSHMDDSKSTLYFMKFGDVWKVGITNNIENRIKNLLRVSPFQDVDVVYSIEIENALTHERSIIRMGEQKQFENKFDGYTEFRLYDSKTLKNILETYFGVDSDQTLV